MLRENNYFKEIRDLMFHDWSTHWDMKLMIIAQLGIIVGLIYCMLR